MGGKLQVQSDNDEVDGDCIGDNYDWHGEPQVDWIAVG